MRIARLFPRAEDGDRTPLPAEEQRPCWTVSLARALLFLLFLGQLLAFAGIKGEDCFITFRYARNLAEGRGLVYNPGEYVEGISNPYWALCNAALYALGTPKGLACTLLIFLHAVAGWWVLSRVARGWFGRGSWWSLLPLLPVACMTALSAGFQNGLEGSAVFLGASLLCAGIALERPAALAAGVFLLLGNRPEAPAFAALAVVWLGWEVVSGRLSRRRGAAWAGVIVGMVAAMVAARWAYYGDIVPNTLRAKGSTPLSIALWPGLEYVGRYALLMGPGLLLLAAFPLLDRTWRARSLFLLVVAGGNAAVVVRNAGDGIGHYRLLTPYCGIVALLAAAGFAVVWRRSSPLWRSALAAVFLSGTLLALDYASLRDALSDLPIRWTLMETWEEEDVFHLSPHVTEKVLSREPDDVLVAENGGWPPFRMKSVRVIEMFGLTDRDLVASESLCVKLVPNGGVINWDGMLAGRRPPYLLFATGFLGEKLIGAAPCSGTASLLNRYVVAQHTELDPFGVFLVRDDRASLEQFIRDYGFFCPASDVVSVLQQDPAVLLSLPADNARGPWALPPWSADTGAESPAEAWQQWEGNQRQRFCAKIPLHEGLNRFTRPLPADGAPLLLTLDLPPGQDGLEIVCRRSGGAALWTLNTDESPLPAGQYRCHYAFLPECPPVEDEVLILEITARKAAEVLVGTGRWCRGLPPPLPASHVYPDITDLRGLLAVYKNPIHQGEALTRLYADAGDSEGLVAEWRGLAAARPGCPTRAWFLARALEAAGRHAEALVEYRRVRDMEHWSLRLPETTPWQAALKRAAVGFFAGLGIPDHSLAADALAGEARIYEAAGEGDAAMRAHHGVLRRQPERFESHEALYRLHTAKGSLKELCRHLEGLVTEQPNSGQTWFWLGMTREGLGDYAGAAQAYRKVLAISSGSLAESSRWPLVRVLCSEAETALAEGRKDDARAPLDEAESLAPGSPRVMLGKARLAELQGDAGSAEAAYRACIESLPDAYDAYSALDRIYAARGDVAALGQLWSGMTSAHPERRHAWFCLGLALERQHWYREAAQAYEEALRRAPPGQEAPPREAMVRALCAAAGTALAEGRTDDARGPLDEAESLSPDAPCVLLGRARLAELTGDTEAALAGYRACVESSPEAYDAYSALDRIHAARGDLAALEELWSGMTSAHPERRHAWFCLGLALERQHWYREAEQAYEEALRRAPPGQEAPPREAMERAIRCAEEEREQSSPDMVALPPGV